MENLRPEISRILREVHPDARISESATDEVIRLITPLNNQLRSVTGIEVDRIVRSFPNELARHAMSEVARATARNRDRSFAVIDYLLAEILELSGSVARNRLRDQDEDVIVTPYDVHKTITEDEELARMFQIPQFPFIGRDRVSNNLASRFPETYLEPDFQAGLNDYLDEFVQGVRQMTSEQISEALTSIGGNPEGNRRTQQNMYIAMITSRIRQAIIRYESTRSGSTLDYLDLLRILSSLR